jgi:hypothetical protein
MAAAGWRAHRMLSFWDCTAPWQPHSHRGRPTAPLRRSRSQPGGRAVPHRPLTLAAYLPHPAPRAPGPTGFAGNSPVSCLFTYQRPPAHAAMGRPSESTRSRIITRSAEAQLGVGRVTASRVRAEARPYARKSRGGRPATLGGGTYCAARPVLAKGGVQRLLKQGITSGTEAALLGRAASSQQCRSMQRRAGIAKASGAPLAKPRQRCRLGAAGPSVLGPLPCRQQCGSSAAAAVSRQACVGEAPSAFRPKAI